MVVLTIDDERIRVTRDGREWGGSLATAFHLWTMIEDLRRMGVTEFVFKNKKKTP